jgi:hypothetical protein
MAGNFQRNTRVALCTRQAVQPEPRASPSLRSTGRSRPVGFLLINCTTANTPSIPLSCVACFHRPRRSREQRVWRARTAPAFRYETSVERHRALQGAALALRTPRPIGTKAYRGRKPSYSRKQLESAHAMLGKSAGVGEVAKVHWATRQMVYRIKDL